MPPTQRRTMNMKLTLAALLTVGTIASVQAAPIIGSIKFGSVDPVSLTGGTQTFLTATGLDFSDPGNNGNAIVNFGATGTFASLPFPGTFAVFKDFTFAPLPGVGADVWEIVGGAFSFHLNTVSVVRTATSITLDGTGVVSGPGYDDNVGSFHFSVQGNNALSTSFTFSANDKFEHVPDAAATMSFLGLALLGLGFVGRRQS